MLKTSKAALLGLILGICSCGQNTTSSDSVIAPEKDIVASILSGSETIDLNKFTWVNKPQAFEIGKDCLTITTSAKTDLWQHTLNGADLSNAPMLVTPTNKDFSFTVKTSFSDASTEYDQCGPIIYVDRNNWLKASVEKTEGAGFLGSVNNIDGKSDWATSSIPEDIKTVWYKVNRTGCDYVISSSFDGVNYNILRFTHFTEAETVCIGLYACSPGEGASFKAEFSEISFN